MTLRRIDSEQYKDSLREVVKKWPANPHDYEATAGSQAAYDEMGLVVLERMREEGIPTSLDTPNARYGFSIIPRFIYAGAAKAEQQGLTMKGLIKAMRHPNSFRQLQLPTRETDPAAREIEFETGLRTTSPYSNVDPRLDEYTIDPTTGLDIPMYAIHRTRARGRLFDERRISAKEYTSDNPDQDPVRCTAHRGSGILALGYKSVLTVAIEDPSLFQATLNRQQ